MARRLCLDDDVRCGAYERQRTGELKMSNEIKILARVGFDKNRKEQREIGVFCGEEIIETVSLSKLEATKLIQEQIYKFSYEEAREFADKYKK